MNVHMNNIFLSVFLLSVFPLCFIFASNPTYYLISQLICTALFIVFFVFCVTGVLFLFIKLLECVFKKNLFKFFEYIALIFSVVVFSITFYNFSLLMVPVWLYIVILSIVGCFGLFLLYSRKLKIFNIFLLTMVILSCFQGLITLSVSGLKNKENVAQSKYNVPFKTKPNVYFILLESWQGQEAMKSIYHYDNKPLYDFLKHNNFTVYDKTYSNYRNTNSSVYAIFTMKHHYWRLHSDYDGNLSRAEKDLIAGSNANTVLNVFRFNGYQINYFLPNEYFFQIPHNLNYYNIKPKLFLPLEILIPDSKHFRKIFDSKLWRGYFGTLSVNKNMSAIHILPGWDTYLEKSWNYIYKYIAQNKKPQFVFIKMGVGHIPWPYKDLPDDKKLTVSKEQYESARFLYTDYFQALYPSWIEQETPKVIKYVDELIKKDPSAVIVIIGDHGPFRTVLMDLYGPDYLKENQKKYGFSDEFFANDNFNVLLAIRYPQNSVKYEGVTSSVNLFRNVFYSLSEDKMFLKQERNISLSPTTVGTPDLIVEDAKVLKPRLLREDEIK